MVPCHGGGLTAQWAVSAEEMGQGLENLVSGPLSSSCLGVPNLHTET